MLPLILLRSIQASVCYYTRFLHFVLDLQWQIDVSFFAFNFLHAIRLALSIDIVDIWLYLSG